MAKKPVKPAAKTAAKAKPAPAKAKTAAPAKPAAEPVPAAAAPAPKKPAQPPKPVPPHQQFLSQGANRGGPKTQHMAKGRIFRHQGR
jgi:hypothetical protein